LPQHYLFPENLPKYDRSPYHFGFFLGINSMDYSIHPVENFKKFDTILTIQSKQQLGFTIGIVSNLRLGTDYADLRFVPSLSFGQRNLNIRFLNLTSLLQLFHLLHRQAG